MSDFGDDFSVSELSSDEEIDALLDDDSILGELEDDNRTLKTAFLDREIVLPLNWASLSKYEQERMVTTLNNNLSSGMEEMIRVHVDADDSQKLWLNPQDPRRFQPSAAEATRKRKAREERQTQREVAVAEARERNAQRPQRAAATTARTRLASEDDEVDDLLAQLVATDEPVATDDDALLEELLQVHAAEGDLDLDALVADLDESAGASPIDQLQELYAELPWRETPYVSGMLRLRHTVVPPSLRTYLEPHVKHLERPGVYPGTDLQRYQTVSQRGRVPGFNVNVQSHGKSITIAYVEDPVVGAYIAAAARIDPRLSRQQSCHAWMRWVARDDANAVEWLVSFPPEQLDVLPSIRRGGRAAGTVRGRGRGRGRGSLAQRY